MQILGVQFDSLVVWQVTTTGVIVSLYGLSVVSDRRRLLAEGYNDLIVMASFVLKHTPDTQIPEGSKLHELIKRFRETGELDRDEPPRPAEKALRVAMVLALAVVAPLVGLYGMTAIFRKREGENVTVYVPTQARVYAFALMLSSFTLSVGYAGLLAYVASTTPLAAAAVVAAILAGLAGFSAVVCVGYGINLTRYQLRWKEWWHQQLLTVMGQAERADDHDLFNRAALLRAEVGAAPNIPIPGTTAFYTGLFAVVQVILYWFAENLS
ncbi:hypothetical protein [Micromonospora andamanensis]|uniref:hypothetical protein n=2 Tax=Micromonospora andamanensis TaxID=1287068 RepID=UPI003628912E